MLKENLNKIEEINPKVEEIPWMFVDWTYSKKNAESMYSNEYVQSGLITRTMWEVMLSFLPVLYLK